SVPCPTLPEGAAPPRTGRLDGPSRRGRRQRGDGELLLHVADQRARLASLGNARRAAARNHPLDRSDLPPASPPTQVGEVDPGGVRRHHETGRRSGGIRNTESTEPSAGPCAVVRGPS